MIGYLLKFISLNPAEHAGSTFLYKIQAHWDIDAKM